MKKNNMYKLNKHIKYQNIQDTENRLYFSYIETNHDVMLTIIDNIADSKIYLYNMNKLDICDITKNEFLSICNYWFYDSSEYYPLSFEMSKRGKTEILSPMYVIIPLESVKIINGHIFHYEDKQKVKKRKAKVIKPLVEVKMG